MVRPHDGQQKTAAILRQLLEGSQNVSRQGEIRVQDGYSLRCVPRYTAPAKTPSPTSSPR